MSEIIIAKNEVVGASVGGVVGSGVGITGSVAAISVAGEVAGLSAAGIASGLASIGGSMIGGVVVLTGGTVILAGAGLYGGYRLLRWWNTL
jgi:hypothetical protein